jgi:hypothetical protein
MKKIALILVTMFAVFTVKAQQNMFTLSGGYVFANLEDADANANGWRINGLWEFNPLEGKFSHGVSFGYIGTKAEVSTLNQNTSFNLNNFPVYYAPKFIIGKGNVKGFVKGALGMHFSNYKYNGTLGDVSNSDFGFYGGAGLGTMIKINDKVFINLEYEWAYLSNSSYRDGFINSAMGGIGFRF